MRPPSTFQNRGLDVVLVERVDKTETSTPGLYQYVVSAQTVALPRLPRQYSTVNEFRANQCLWGRDSQWPLLVAWRRSAYGRELVAVERAERRPA